MNKRMITGSILSGAILLTLVPFAVLQAQNVASGRTVSPPDFSGVYYPLNPFGRNALPAAPKAAPKGGAPARPTQSAPLADGSQGRGPDAPQLTPEYLAKWEMIRKSRMSGSYEYDPTAKCLPPGMPAMMTMAYGMEIMQTKDKITFFSELNDALRRVFLDGRKPSQKVLDDPTYAGYSMGHWEGDTLVVETVGLRDDSFIEGFTPHSDAMTVHERIRLAEPDLLEDQITVTDPKALTKPWSTVKRYRKAKTGQGDELREFACPEGLGEAK
jgi:hypothetical protein